MFVALGFVLVTSVQLTTAEPKSSKEDESESKTPNVVDPFVLRKLLTWISTDEGWMSSGDFFGPPPDEERTDKRRPSEKSNATKSSETPSRRGSSREKRIACNIMIKVGPKRENKRKPPEDDGSSQNFRNGSKQSNTEDNATNVQQNSSNIPTSQERSRGRPSPQGSRERVSSSTQRTTGPPPGEEDDSEGRP